MRTRIADDPDSWGKPPDLQKPIASDDSKCPSCGVQWMHHMADMCPITVMAADMLDGTAGGSGI
jgi:hypothetical protein